MASVPETRRALCRDDADVFERGEKGVCTFVSVLAVAACLCFVGGLVFELLTRQGYLSSLEALYLAGLASTCFVVCGVGLAQWAPTADLGQKFIQRVTHTRSNWDTDTLRSVGEVGIWLGVVWSTFQKSDGGVGGIMLSLIAGTIAGCLLAIMGDLLQGTLRSFTGYRYQDAKTKTDVNNVNSDQRDMCITYGAVTLLALFGHGALQNIYEHCHNVGIACLLAATAGCVLVTVSKLIQFWTPMRHAGFTMQLRITNTVENWQKYPVRSAIESTFWVGCLIGTYETVGSVTFALQVATFAGIVICLSSELFWNRFLESEALHMAVSGFSPTAC